MSKFLETLVRSQGKSCKGKINFPREDSAARSAVDMMNKKPGELFESYKCAYCSGWHIGHQTNFDWIPASHQFFSLLMIQYGCKCGTVFLTSTVIHNRIFSHFPAVMHAKESFVRCASCKALDALELARKVVELVDLPNDSTETVESLWDANPGHLELVSETSETENQRLRAAIRNQCGDNLCWIVDPDLGKILPREEFLQSCSRYYAQLQEEKGVIPSGSMTVSQLEARIVELEDELKKF